MRGRFVLYSSGEPIADAFDLAEVLKMSPRYNVAPTQPVAVIRTCPNGRELALLKWGLVPPWAKDAKMAPINAKAETAADMPFFRHAMRKRPYLISPPMVVTSGRSRGSSSSRSSSAPGMVSRSRSPGCGSYGSTRAWCSTPAPS